MGKVLFIGELNRELPEYQEFLKNHEVVEYTVTSREQVVEDFATKLHDIDAIYGAWLGFALVGGFNKELVAHAPASLKVIAVCSVGHDIYDGEALAKRGIVLTNVPSHGAAGPVADLVLYNTLTSFRNFHVFTKNLTPERNHTVLYRAGLEASSLDLSDGSLNYKAVQAYGFGETLAGRANRSPEGHHAVIIGFGNIGQTIGGRLAAIGMHIHYVKRTPLDETQFPYPLTYHKTIEDAADVADLVVVACPGTSETRHLINDKVIARFAKPVRIINIGRGSVIDEQALVDGLKSGKVLFAGLDVFEEEPTIHKELLGRNDVVLTPHVGASTQENFDYTAVTALQNIDHVLLGGAGLHRVN